MVKHVTDTGKVDMVMNVVERPSGGFSAGGGISSGYVMCLMEVVVFNLLVSNYLCLNLILSCIMLIGIF